MNYITSHYITSGHSLSESILAKKYNNTVSQTTLSKISEKLVEVRQSCCKGSNEAEGPIDLGKYIEEMNKANSALKQIENQAVYETIKSKMSDKSEKFIHKMQKRILHTRKYNIEFTTDELKKISKQNAELKTVQLCKIMSEECKTKMVDFSCLDSFFSHIKNESKINMMAITKMVRKEGNDAGHYSCIHVIKENNEIKLAVHEPFLSDPETTQGIVNLQCIVREYTNEGKLNADAIRVGVVNRNVKRQENYKDKFCLRDYFSLACKLDGRENHYGIAIAAELSQRPEEQRAIFSHLNHNGDKFSFLSTKSKQTADSKEVSELKNSDLPKPLTTESHQLSKTPLNEQQKLIQSDAPSDVKKKETNEGQLGRFVKHVRTISSKASKTRVASLVALQKKQKLESATLVSYKSNKVL